MRYSYEETDSDLQRSSLISKKRNYSHCPLKKRPVHFIKDYDEDEPDYKKIIKKGKQVKYLSSIYYLSSFAQEIPNHFIFVFSVFFHHVVRYSDSLPCRIC